MANPTQPSPSRVVRFVKRGSKELVNYAVTDADYLTLLRAIEREGPPENMVTWTLLQRFAYLFPLYTSLERFVKAYAQPINPDWFPDGKRHLDYVRSLRDAGKTAEADKEIKDAAKRVQYAATPLAQIRPKIRATVDSVLASGANTPAPGSVHYRAPTIRTTDVQKAKDARQAFAATHAMIAKDIGDPRTENWFFSEAGAQSFRIELLALSGASIALLLGLGFLLLHLTGGIHG